MSYKDRKTQFVSDLVGGSTLDIYLVTSISAFSYLLWCLLKKKSNLFNDETKVSKIWNVSTFIDFLLNWHNILLATTIFANRIVTLYVINIVLFILILIISLKKGKTNKNELKLNRTVTINLKTLTSRQFLTPKTYITVYRAQMMIITCICIMAVDFNVFPRRFGKVETWGTSLMDLGVGSFVFSMGLINARSFIGQEFNTSFKYFETVWKTFKNCIPILILGLIRFISVRSVDYHEHITEYGKHWNFFFTLSFLPIINSILIPIIKLFSPLLTSFIISFFYEYLLINKGLLEYIITSDRIGLLNANREGILSLFGYYPIFLNGFALGTTVLTIIPINKSPFKISVSKMELQKQLSNTKKMINFESIQFKKMILMGIFYQILYYVVDTCYIYSVSRRMANLLYVIWVSAYNCTFLYMFGKIEQLIFGEKNIKILDEKDEEVDESLVKDIGEKPSDGYIPLSLQAVNQNSLVLFLIANLATGLINLTFNTIDSSNNKSMIILYGYETILSMITLILYQRKIKLR